MEGLPVVRKDEPIEEWLGRAVPALMEKAKLDEATAKDVATRAWNTVNGTGDQPDAEEAGGWPDAEEADDPFAADADPLEGEKGKKKPVKGEDEEDLAEDDLPADEMAMEDEADPFAAGVEEPAVAEGEEDPELLTKGEEDATEGEEEDPFATSWEEEDTWGEGLLNNPEADAEKQPAKAEEEVDGTEPPATDASTDKPAGPDPKPNKPILASGETLTWFHEQMVNAGDMIASALAGNGNIKPEEADLLGAELRRLLDKLLPAPNAAPGSATKASTLITYLEAMIHRDFTNMADTLREQGNLTRSERIALSNCVGDMLVTFIDAVKQNLGPEFMHRSPFTDIEQYRSDDRGEPVATPAPAAPPPAPTADETPATKDGTTPPETPAAEALPAPEAPAATDAPGELTLTITLPPVEPDLYTKSLRGGFTFQIVGDPDVAPSTTGKFAVLPLPERGLTIAAAGLTSKTVADFIARNADAWGMEGATLGGWSDPASGVTRLDVTVTAGSEANAIDLARRYEQTHYLDLATGKAIPVPAVNKSAALDLETLRSIWIATKGFIGPSFRAKYRLDDDPVDLVTVKAIGRNRAGGYLCLWGDEGHKDLSGEFFTPNTQELTSIFDAMGGVPAIYHHAFDDVMKSMVVGVIDTMKRDDVGLWVEDQIRLADEYQKYIQPLIAKRKLGWSSGTLPGARRVNKATGEILRWPIVEGSKTFSPAEWRMSAQWPIEPLKSAYTAAGLNKGELDRLFTKQVAQPQRK